MDTTELGAGYNPVPDEVETKTIDGTITITFDFKDEDIPSTWDKETIIEYIENNYREYLQDFRMIEDITIQ